MALEVMKSKIAKMQEKHNILLEYSFDVVELDKGYANRYLRVDLMKKEVTIQLVTEQMKDLWVGGKGFDLWLTFKEITPQTRWDSPENPICFSPGPLGGTTSFPGSGKTLVTAISPLTNIMIDSNVGGYFGPYLKFAGFDALLVIGKAEEDVVLVIDAAKGKIRIETAPEEHLDSHILAEELTEMYADNELDKRNVAVVSSGSAAAYSRIAMLNFSFWDWRRGVTRFKQAGRGGIGMVFRDKGLKAIVAKNLDITPAWRIEESKVAHLLRPEKISIQEDEGDITKIIDIINKWHKDEEYVIEMMQDIQQEFRHISQTAIDLINKETGKPKAYLYHIATFYKSLSLDEKGELNIQVCMGTTCHVKGAARIIDRFEQILGIKCGETTKDKKYSLEAVACLGACSIAPVIKIGEKVVGNVQVKDVERLIKDPETDQREGEQK
ncbi:MAG: NAD(P)H-dependent oxidoreductase subunit E [Candidatus Cloacimonetes bacterium]|nr:NAD(P)H-dependent oxidoreductase subunit E [Candidatus Cloacimonadota bacterium]